MTSQTATHTPAPGTVVNTFTARGVRIDLIKGVSCWTVNTWRGAEPVTGWCHTYSTEAEARTEARRSAQVFLAHGTPDLLAAHRQDLIARRDQLSRLSRTAAHLAAVAAIDAELDNLMDLSTRAQLPAFIADLTSRLAA